MLKIDNFIKRKIKIIKQTSWKHHRSGWSCCMNSIKPLHSDSGILLIDYFDEFVKNKNTIDEPWVGFIHNCVKNPKIIAERYGEKNSIDIEKMINSKFWEKNIKLCKGLFCLCKKSSDFIESNTKIKVSNLVHPTGTPSKYFCWSDFHSNQNKRLLMIGHWMRNFEAFFSLKCRLKKTLLCVDSAFNYHSLGKIPENININPRLEDDKYDELLSLNPVFLNLYDTAACNTIIECMVRNTPIVVNRLPSTEEYLGSDYPLLYENLDQAQRMINDESALYDGHMHILSNKKKISLSPQYFFESFVRSKVYVALGSN